MCHLHSAVHNSFEFDLIYCASDFFLPCFVSSFMGGMLSAFLVCLIISSLAQSTGWVGAVINTSWTKKKKKKGKRKVNIADICLSFKNRPE